MWTYTVNYKFASLIIVRSYICKDQTSTYIENEYIDYVCTYLATTHLLHEYQINNNVTWDKIDCCRISCSFYYLQVPKLTHVHYSITATLSLRFLIRIDYIIHIPNLYHMIFHNNYTVQQDFNARASIYKTCKLKFTS